MNNLARFEKLTTSEEKGSYKIKNLKKTQDEVIFLCNFNLKVTAVAAYHAGERLIAIRETMDRGKFTAWLNSEEFPLSKSTAYNYMQLYERFRFPTVGKLDDMSVKEALTAVGIIKPKKSQEENALGYNRIDLGGNPGQGELDFGELFNLPTASNQPLKNYRTIGDMLTEIVIVRRTEDDLLISKRIVQFYEDIPQDPHLRLAFKRMSQETQAAVEKYLAALEQTENQSQSGNHKKAPRRPRKPIAE